MAWHLQLRMAMTTTAETIDIGLKTDALTEVSDILQQVLADAHVLYLKTRNYHWNLAGGRFHSLHALYEEQYKAIEISIDEIAERIRMLGCASPGSMSEMLSFASLKERKGQLITPDDSLASLLSDHETVIQMLRAAIASIEDSYQDAGTADLLTGLLQDHEKMAWMLRSMTALETNDSQQDPSRSQ